ncbi:MAG: hypothetical protein V3T17_08700 [Pseudomonadales bacterium]
MNRSSTLTLLTILVPTMVYNVIALGRDTDLVVFAKKISLRPSRDCNSLIGQPISMCHKWLNTSIFLLIVIFSNSTAVAQSLSAEQAKLAVFETQLGELQTDQQQLQAELSKKKTELGPLLNQSSPEKDNLDAALNNVDKAKADYEANPTTENKSRLKNAEFKHMLAGRKFKKANAQQFTLQQETKELAEQLTVTHSEIATLTSNVNAQRLAVEKSRAQQLARQQANREQKQKLKAKAAATEIARLKAQIEEQEKVELARKAAAAAALATKAAAPSVPTATVPAPSNNTATPISLTKSSPIVTKTAPVPANKSAKHTGAILLTTKEQVQVEEQRLMVLLATPEEKKRSKYNKILNVRPVSANSAVGKAQTNTLYALGHNQYRGNITITAGDIIFIVGFNRWRQQVPTTPEGTEYTVIFDTADTKNPRLVYFPTSLSN